MQKHSDRGHTKDGRGPFAGQGHGLQAQNAAGGQTGNNATAGAGTNGGQSSLPVALGGGATEYWKNVDPAGYAAATSGHERVDYSSTAAQSLLDPRMNPHSAVHRDMVDPRHHMDEQLRAHHAAAQLGAGYADPASVAAGAAVSKTSSAFSPIQGSMLQTAASGGFPMSAGSRSYFPYDTIGFQKHSQVRHQLLFKYTIL